jgi:hypothetical protein
MATPTKYTYNQKLDIYSVVKQVNTSAIVTVLDHVDVTGNVTDIWFKDALSSEDQTLLNAVITNYTLLAPPAFPPTQVVTQYELNDKDLKLARGKIVLNNSNIGTSYVVVPGTIGSSDGRYVAGGYAISEDYNKDDAVLVYIEDKDRIIAMGIALSMNPNATTPVSDATVQGAGVIPGYGAFPNYPTLKSYTDDEQPTDNQGWYFWPLANGTSSAAGECEVEPIGGYGFIPAGFYIKLIYLRPVGVNTGSCRVNYYWGKKG